MKRYALIGEDVSASRSPEVHAELFREYGISAEYDLLSLNGEDARKFFREMAFRGYDGLNITAPYKREVIPFLDALSPEAAAVGAVNTVRIADSKCIGYNTDVDGFDHSLPESFRRKAASKILLFGAGGAARAVLAALGRGANPTVRIMNRTRAHAEEMAERFRHANPGGLHIEVFDAEANFSDGEAFDLIVNTTSAYFFSDEAGNLTFFNKNVQKLLKKNGILYDIKYGIEGERWKRSATERGLFCLDGRKMLFCQAFYAHVRWGNIDLERHEELDSKHKNCFSTTEEEENRDGY